jgi:hypothetical protein
VSLYRRCEAAGNQSLSLAHLSFSPHTPSNILHFVLSLLCRLWRLMNLPVGLLDREEKKIAVNTWCVENYPTFFFLIRKRLVANLICVERFIHSDYLSVRQWRGNKFNYVKGLLNQHRQSCCYGRHEEKQMQVVMILTKTYGYFHQNSTTPYKKFFRF